MEENKTIDFNAKEEISKEFALSQEILDNDFVQTVLAIPDEMVEALRDILIENFADTFKDPMTRLQLTKEMAQFSNMTLEQLDKVAEDSVREIEKLDTTDEKKDIIRQFTVLMWATIREITFFGPQAISVDMIQCRERGDVPLPRYMKEGDSGMDVYALEDYDIGPGETVLIPTGIQVSIPKGYEIQVRNKSGMAHKTKLRVANAVGTIDRGYLDEIGVLIENIEPKIKDIEIEDEKVKSIEYGKSYLIEKGKRFAQLVIVPVGQMFLNEVSEFSKGDTDRGGGFGSTGLE